METKGLRVLLISSLGPPVGGVETWSRAFLDWAKTNHVCADIVNTALLGHRAEHFGANRRLWDEIRRTRAIFAELDRKVSAFRPDVVHLNTVCGRFGIARDYLCAVAVTKKGIPLVVHFRCNVGDQIDGRPFQTYFFRKLISLAGQTLVLNAESECYVRQVAGSESQRVANFVDASFIITRPKQISSSIRTVLYVGHVQATKGSQEVVAAACLMPEIEFIVAGPVAPDMSSLTIPANVRLLGSVGRDRVQQLLDESDVFVFPSYTEGFSNALVEAMARGVPVIATPVGANADMIEESGGILVRVGIAVDIVSAIGQMGPKEVRERMSLWNTKKVEGSYTVDSVMHRLLQVYGEVVHKTSCGRGER